MTEATAPTITIDGVISAPGKPVSMVRLGCDCVSFWPAHGFIVGGAAGCGTCGIETTLVSTFETWVF